MVDTRVVGNDQIVSELIIEALEKHQGWAQVLTWLKTFTER